MDDCSLSDSRGNLDGIVFGPSCGCGVISNGLEFSSGNQFAEFDRGLNTILSGDWTISLYVLVDESTSDATDILYLGDQCRLDSLLSLRYLPDSRIFRFILSDSPNNDVRLDAFADDNSCWQYLTITKEGATGRFYLNGSLASEDMATSSLALNVDAALAISNSPCQSAMVNPDAPFVGVMDELRIYDRALTVREINNADFRPDQIITNDTTIFVGASLVLSTGGACSDDFTWAPSTYLNDASLINPISTPTEDITYTLTINGDGCTSIDQVTIRVADQSELTCDDLLLPSAFTPNNDFINDSYGISNQFLIEDLRSFEIFNRWGGRVFFTNAISGTWDGMYKGSPAPANAYVYKVSYTCEGQVFDKTGTVNIIR